MAHFHRAARPRTRPNARNGAHAPQPLFPAAAPRRSQGSRDRLAPADAPGRADPPSERRHLFLAAAWVPRSAQDRGDRARGAGPRRRARASHAHHPAGRDLAGERPLRSLRQGDAAHQRPPRARDAVRADQRGADHRDLPRRGEILQGPAAHPLSHPMEVPRRDQAALRRDARPRVPDEGFLFLRSHRRRRAQILQQDVRLLFAHLRPHGTEIGADGRRDRPDRRQSQPRVHHPRRHRRERGLLPSRSRPARSARRRHRL